MTNLSLKREAIKGIGWVSVITFFTRTSRFIVTLFLAKLLIPEDFGVMAIGLLVVNILILFREVGVGAALIHKQENIEKAASTAFFIIIGVSIILFTITCLVSNYIVQFFRYQISTKMVCFLAFSIVLSAIGKTHFLQLQKSLNFQKEVFPEFISIIGYACITIILALSNYGVWSLVYGHLASELLRTVMLIIVTPWQPRLEFDMKSAKELLSFGKHVLGSTFTIYLFNNLDQIIIGRVLGTKLLGFYSFGYRIANLPAQNIAQIVGHVMFPVYSQMQLQTERFRNAYLNTFKYISALTIPIAFGILLLAPHLFKILYGSKWDSAIPVLQILCVYGLFRSFGSLAGSVLMSKGYPQWLWYVAGVQVLIVLPLVYTVSKHFGIEGVAILFTGAIVIGVILALRKVAQILNIEFRQYILLCKNPLIAALPTFVVIELITINIFSTITLPILVIEILLIGGGYILLLYILDKKLITESLKLIGNE